MRSKRFVAVAAWAAALALGLPRAHAAEPAGPKVTFSLPTVSVNYATKANGGWEHGYFNVNPGKSYDLDLTKYNSITWWARQDHCQNGRPSRVEFLGGAFPIVLANYGMN